MPVTVLSTRLRRRRLWRAWVPDLRHTTVTCRHLMAEEAPDDIAKALRELLAR